jgi:hypothetical protein
MDAMRREGVKRAVIWIGIRFDRQGRPKEMAVNRAEFYSGYGDTTPIRDGERLKEIRSSDLQQTLDGVALERVRHGFWIDIPRPKPKPFDGGAQIEFFDDEWLPTPNAPLFCAGKSCLPE